MRMNANNENKYWRLSSYIKIHLVQAYTSKTIIKNMRKYGSLHSQQFRYALMWGSAPEVVIQPLDNNYCGVSKAFGCFDATNAGVIMLDEKLVQAFQDNPNDPNTRFPTAKGASLPIVGATILHELCHWGNYRAGRNETREMGHAFELATYGVVIAKPGYSSFDEDESITPL